MQPYSFIGCGYYTNAATPAAQNIAITEKPDCFRLRILTNWGAPSTAADPIY